MYVRLTSYIVAKDTKALGVALLQLAKDVLERETITVDNHGIGLEGPVSEKSKGSASTWRLDMPDKPLPTEIDILDIPGFL